MLKTAAQALELTGLSSPDIILTDLRMPEMDGMSLIRNIRRQDKRCRFLILTCVEDFEQAQEAIAYSVSGYLLKLTMDFKEVEKMLQKAVDELSVLPGGPSYVGMPNLSDAKERFFKEYFTLHNCNARNSFREYVDRLSASSERKESSCRRPYSYFLCFLQGSQASLKGTDGAKLHSGRSP